MLPGCINGVVDAHDGAAMHACKNIDAQSSCPSQLSDCHVLPAMRALLGKQTFCSLQLDNKLIFTFSRLQHAASLTALK